MVFLLLLHLQIYQINRNRSALIFIKAPAPHPTPLCGSSFISYEGAPLMKRFIISALCASTHAQLTNRFMAELLLNIFLIPVYALKKEQR